MLAVQKTNNPDMVCARLGSIEMTTFENKEFDLVLLIDVLEHVPDDGAALREIGRIAKYAIIKIPLENTLHSKIIDRLRGKSHMDNALDSVGHVNFYGVGSYASLIKKFQGIVVGERFTNIFDFFVRTPGYASKMNWRQFMMNWICSKASLVAPRLTAKLFRDHVVMLVHFPS
jgi:ubiquinone/menaquinone biosynthesis C-methylase UbiE